MVWGRGFMEVFMEVFHGLGTGVEGQEVFMEVFMVWGQGFIEVFRRCSWFGDREGRF